MSHRDEHSCRKASRRASRLGALGAAAAVATLLGCHAGTPAAPEGSEIPVAYEYISRDIPNGDFDAIISATVIDEVSDVPQVGVGVYFRVTAGPGQFTDEGPIVTDNAGHAESVLLARGSATDSEVTVEVSSGEAVATLKIDVFGGFSPTNERPELRFTVEPASPRGGENVTVDVGNSTDEDCPDGEPDTWTVDWGDATPPTTGTFDGSTEATHRYPTSASSQTFTMVVTIEDCTGLTDTESRDIVVVP